MAREIITLSDGTAEAAVAPSLGGGLVSYDFMMGAKREPLFRKCRDMESANPFDLANNLLVPWSNRISGGGFKFRDQFYPLRANLAGEPLPIHGNGFSANWTAVKKSREALTIELPAQYCGPFFYQARMTYALTGQGRLSMCLAVTNLGIALPFGLGFHPWLPRMPQTYLLAKSEHVTLQDARYLPTNTMLAAARNDWDFSESRRLPSQWINNDFDGWDGHAVVEWRDRGLSLGITAPGATRYIVYSPAADAGFFCFEPVSHAIDAFNRAGGPVAHGLTILDCGQSLSITCNFTPKSL